MGTFMQNSIIIVAIIIDILGVLLAAAYIYKSCTKEGIANDVSGNYFAQINNCFIWSILVISFMWLVTSSGTNNLIFTGIKIAIFLWVPVLFVSILCMFPFIKFISKNINPLHVTNLRKISAKSAQYIAILIVVFWFIT